MWYLIDQKNEIPETEIEGPGELKKETNMKPA
jgi:hypothetical protein